MAPSHERSIPRSTSVPMIAIRMVDSVSVISSRWTDFALILKIVRTESSPMMIVRRIDSASLVIFGWIDPAPIAISMWIENSELINLH